MNFKEEYINIAKNDLLDKVTDYYKNGYRLVQISARRLSDGIELNYSFDKGYNFENLRFIVKNGEEIPSISLIYWASFGYENELHDLFGLNIKNINIDFNGTFYKTSVKTPFNQVASNN